MAAGQVLSYYLNGWNDYKINLKRVAELERVRLSKREAGCDVVVADLVLQSSVRSNYSGILHTPNVHS